MKSKADRRKKIHRGIRRKIKGTSETPRLSIYRSNKAIYCQIIDDVSRVTLASASSIGQKEGNKSEQAKAVGTAIAEQAKAANVSKVVFDRGGYLFHGRVKSLADGAREGGLQF